MAGFSTLAIVCASALAGTAVGFAAGLVPGLHMNNIAAMVSSYAASALGAFAGMSGALESPGPAIALACFLCSAMVSHVLAEAVPSTYVGIPSGDVVSVLPAHRLARAGLGRSAVRASADGALAGITVSTILLVPACLLMGGPIRFYGLLKGAMGLIVILLSCVLLASEGSSLAGSERSRVVRILRGSFVFVAAGLLGLIVLKSGFYSCSVPDVPWLPRGFVPRESLLLPLFAGLFGVPSLLLSLRSQQVADTQGTHGCVHIYTPRPRDMLLSLVGGSVVGWMPGMTSGSAATLCSPTMRETVKGGDIGSALRFIWLYSSISGSGCVFALGALFAIARARSGTMNAVDLFLGGAMEDLPWPGNAYLMILLALSMSISALLAYAVIRAVDLKVRPIRRVLASSSAAVAALGFVAVLSVALTGTRGAMVLSASALLGLIPPLAGIRRIQLMGCLLVPIVVTLVAV